MQLTQTALLSTALALAATTAHANTTTAAPDPAPAPVAAVAAPLPVTPAPVPADVARGRFSAGRLIVEILAGGLAGGLAGYAAFDALGGDDVGAALAGLGANIAVTPLVVYGVGRAMGGRGTLGTTYLGGMLAFSGPAATPDQAAVSFAVGMALMPVTSAIVFELGSHVRSKRLEAVANHVAVAPIVDGDGVRGARVGFGFAF